MNDRPPLRRIHGERTLESRRYAASLAHWRQQSTDQIVASLLPGQPDALKVKSDGRVFDGNTRIRVLEERGFEVDALPREELP